MNTPKEYQPPGKLNDFSISMTANVNRIKKMTFKMDVTDCIINWGDDSLSYEATHEYDLEGCYTICIRGRGLKKLDIRNCFLDSLTLDEAPDLMNLRCAHNHLKVLDLSRIINLEVLDCYGAELKKLDVRNCGNIERLNCGKNQISELYATGCKNLRVLICVGNKLKNLNVQGCEGLEWMDCSDNLLNTEALNLLCQSLPLVNNIKGGHICIGNNEGAHSCEIAKFNKKCWNVDDFKISRS